MRYLLDTCVISDFIKGETGTQTRLKQRWDMAVLRESPWYQQILKEGIQEGRQEGEIQLVLRLLKRRFGVLDEGLQQQIQRLSVEKLETLAEELLDFSTLQDLETWLKQN
ncbi:DUF4351 domain-containing protein [Euhalothece natronophila Z-M001]|uniref:DUF4351 domain-containing protein n=1 Tax=Euhalothece natronophila Z-M001 TaxID=522448 RepID=A0A5B8NRM0_9CHRO|nr:DUF4351 domain-containing protein [Euhalothece natronophila]QDZ40720.1 DUF4351 domain-containing protein [Euhalothece natronophila Z-M001]